MELLFDALCAIAR